MTLVSVVVPTKGRAVAVVDCVRSVFQGEYQDFEFVVASDEERIGSERHARAGWECRWPMCTWSS
jgi:hypothetical protein